MYSHDSRLIADLLCVISKEGNFGWSTRLILLFLVYHCLFFVFFTLMTISILRREIPFRPFILFEIIFEIETPKECLKNELIRWNYPFETFALKHIIIFLSVCRRRMKAKRLFIWKQACSMKEYASTNFCYFQYLFLYYASSYAYLFTYSQFLAIHYAVIFVIYRYGILQYALMFLY